jgi:hypothetical protein
LGHQQNGKSFILKPVEESFGEFCFFSFIFMIDCCMLSGCQDDDGGEEKRLLGFIL